MGRAEGKQTAWQALLFQGQHAESGPSSARELQGWLVLSTGSFAGWCRADQPLPQCLMASAPAFPPVTPGFS